MERISTQEAADRKGCTMPTIRNALATGKIEGEQVGKVRIVLVNRAFEEWEPNPRIQKAVKERWAKATG